MTNAERVKLIIAQAQLEDSASAIAAEIKAAREEGRRAGMMEAAHIVEDQPIHGNARLQKTLSIAAIEAKAKEG